MEAPGEGSNRCQSESIESLINIFSNKSRLDEEGRKRKGSNEIMTREVKIEMENYRSNRKRKVGHCCQQKKKKKFSGAILKRSLFQFKLPHSDSVTGVGVRSLLTPGN